LGVLFLGKIALEWQREIVDRIMKKTQDLSLKVVILVFGHHQAANPSIAVTRVHHDRAVFADACS